MLTIRLSRVGKKSKPTYRLIISEKARDPYGRALEILGSYDPHTKDLKVKKERILHWVENGASLSDTVNNLLINNKIIEGKKVKTTKLKTKKRLAKKAEKTKAEKPEKKEEKLEETTKNEKSEEVKKDEVKTTEEKK